VVVHLARLWLQTYVTDLAQQQTNVVRDVKKIEAGIAQQLWCLFDGRQNQHAH
jgi:hypothetical protein